MFSRQHQYNLFLLRVWSVSYNHFHDQLVLSSSSDSRVMLFKIMSISSEPFGQYEEIEDEESTLKKYVEYLKTHDIPIYLHICSKIR